MNPILVYSPLDKEFGPDSAVRPKASHWAVRRNKARICAAQIPFTHPAPAQLPSRCSHAQVGGSIFGPPGEAGRIDLVMSTL
jgi:hypothetical protein